MNDRPRAVRRARRTWPPTVRSAAAVLATAALLLLAAACSGSPSSAGPGGAPGAEGSTKSRQAVAFSECMRAHGVPNYPDPGSSGVLPKTSAQRLKVSSAQFNGAERGCQHLLPTTGGALTAGSLQQCYLADVCPQALVQHAVTAGRGFSRCMRAHGVPNWPDPTIDSQGRPLFNINVPRPAPRQTSVAISECSRLDHAGSLLAWG
jgi:hypothetical protein